MRKDRLQGGLADDMQPEDFNPQSLLKGIRVEVEHTNDEDLALEIAMDHLAEDPEYYDKLALMEARHNPIDPIDIKNIFISFQRNPTLDSLSQIIEAIAELRTEFSPEEILSLTNERNLAEMFASDNPIEGANPNTIRGLVDNTLTYSTDLRNDLQQLLEVGVDVNHTDYQGRTMLMMATVRGKEDAVQMLLENGADVNKIYMHQGRIPMTALDAAMETKRTNIATILRSYGALTGR